MRRTIVGLEHYFGIPHFIRIAKDTSQSNRGQPTHAAYARLDPTPFTCVPPETKEPDGLQQSCSSVPET